MSRGMMLRDQQRVTQPGSGSSSSLMHLFEVGGLGEAYTRAKDNREEVSLQKCVKVKTHVGCCREGVCPLLVTGHQDYK